MAPPAPEPANPGFRQQRGRAAEAYAAAQLEQRGWRILGRNLRTPQGEIDLLAIAGGVLVAVEVKARHPLSWAHGEDALRPAQRRRLGRALLWSAARLRWRGPARVDLAAVEWLGEQPCGFELLAGIEEV